MCHSRWCTSYQPWRYVLHHLQTELFSFYDLFCSHLSMDTALNHPHPHHWLFLLSQIFIMAVLLRPTVLTHMPLLAATLAHSFKFLIFLFIFFYFLIIFFFIIVIFRTSSTTSFVVMPHFLHHCLYCLPYAPNAFSFSIFSSFLLFNFFLPVIQFFVN